MTPQMQQQRTKRMVYDELIDKQTRKMIDNIKKRSVTNPKTMPSLIIIDGGQGFGKTTLAYEIACYLIGKKVNVKEIIGCGGVNFQERYMHCQRKKLPAIIYDESEDFSKKVTLSKFNRMLMQTFSTMRAFKIVVILCLPYMGVLENDLFDIKVPRLLLHIYKDEGSRRRFTVHGLYRMLYIRNKMKELIVKDKAYFITKPNFKGAFKDIPETEAKELEDFTISEKIKMNEKNSIKMMGVMTIKDMARDLNRTPRWVSGKLKTRNIKADRVMSGKNYYDDKILDLLAGDVSDG